MFVPTTNIKTRTRFKRKLVNNKTSLKSPQKNIWIFLIAHLYFKIAYCVQDWQKDR